MFDEHFIQGLPEDPYLAGKYILDSVKKSVDQAIKTFDQKDYYDVLEGMGLLRAYVESFKFNISFPELKGPANQNLMSIKDFLFKNSASFEQEFIFGHSTKFKGFLEKKFSRWFLYKFTEGDLSRIQFLINELRTIIRATEGLEDSHKSRLLVRLENLQSELHKSVSDLDKFWGLLIDASIVLKKIGENAKPIIDRVREIIDIIWRVQIRAEELPSNVPLELPSCEGRSTTTDKTVQEDKGE